MARQKRRSVQEVAMGALEEAQQGGDTPFRDTAAGGLARREGPIPDNPHPHRQIRRRLNPRKLTPWRFADRTDSEMEHLEELAESMRTDGQYQPIIVRPVAERESVDGADYEIIAGQVRWRAALHADMEMVDCIVKEVDDATAMRIMVSENELRRGISALSRARSLREAIGPGGIYANQAEAARALNLTTASISRYIQIAGIPASVWSAFSSPHSASLRLATALGRAVADGYEAEIIALAEDIESGRIAPEQLPWELEAARREAGARTPADSPQEDSGAVPDKGEEDPPSLADPSPMSQRRAPAPRRYATASGQTYMTYRRTRSGTSIRIPTQIEKSLGDEELEQLAEEIAEVVLRRLPQ